MLTFSDIWSRCKRNQTIWTTETGKWCDDKLQFVLWSDQTSHETGTEVQLSERLSRGLGATLSGEMEISHCDYNLHCPKLDQLSTGVSRLAHNQWMWQTANIIYTSDVF